MKKYFLFFLIIVSVKLNSQSLTAYTDQRGYFTVFDNGNTSTLEFNLPKSFQVGGNCIAYQDFNSNFKVYYNGETITLYEGAVNSYKVTHNLLLYVIAGQLRVFDRGKTKVISVYPGDYYEGDSLVAFIDYSYKALCVYYKGEIIPVENNIATNPLLGFQASNNTLAYINNQREFKVFWNGVTEKIFTLSPSSDVNYQTGSNIVAFIANASLSLSVFYKGSTYNVSSLPVKSYKAADDMVAYEDQNGLHAFYAGKNYDLCSAASYNYDISDSVLIYYTPGYFRVFNKGKITVLDNYMPDEYALDNNTVVWANQQGGLEAFYNGETYDLTNFDRAAFKLEGNTLWFKSQTSANKIFLCGKTFSY
ncbi:MAG TPA: hypothetical protein VNZ49_00640 [Bacteroidia bacterium]|jgi:hypothetical protein|nr:hypothetical protein [Bacteroidia bacterium]